MKVHACIKLTTPDGTGFRNLSKVSTKQREMTESEIAAFNRDLAALLEQHEFEVKGDGSDQ